jgi:hypothetical protein
VIHVARLPLSANFSFAEVSEKIKVCPVDSVDTNDAKNNIRYQKPSHDSYLSFFIPNLHFHSKTNDVKKQESFLIFIKSP